MIDILLSTYNGERYLLEQIESILQQTVKTWHLYIRDDGSTDQTGNIIKEYVQKHPDKITWINEHNIRNVGVVKSFEILLQYSKAPYFMFCDQDDVWLSFKIAKTYAALQEVERQIGVDMPVVVHTDVKVVDANLQVLYPSFFELLKFPQATISTNKNYAMLFNYVTGCTMLGNAKARDLSLPFPEFIDMHDSWIARVAWLENGKVLSLFEPTMLYRQHGTNVLGSANKLSLKQKVKSFFNAYQQYRLLYKKHTWLAPFMYIYYKCKFKICYANRVAN